MYKDVAYIEAPAENAAILVKTFDVGWYSNSPDAKYVKDDKPTPSTAPAADTVRRFVSWEDCDD